MRGLIAGIAMAWAIGAMPLAHADPYEADPDLANRDADYAAAKVAIEKNDWNEAVRRLQKTLVREPESADLQNLLGYSYRNLGQLEAAFKHYKQALVLDPRHRGAHEYIGETYLLAGDVKGAEKHLAALKEICLLPCEELDDLERAIAEYRAKGSK